MEVRLGEQRDSELASLQGQGIDASLRGTRNLAFSIMAKALDEHLKLISDLLKSGEEASRA